MCKKIKVSMTSFKSLTIGTNLYCFIDKFLTVFYLIYILPIQNISIDFRHTSDSVNFVFVNTNSDIPPSAIADLR